MPTSSASADPLALPPGTVLSEFVVRRVLGSGGFGIVYLARDDSLQRDVAVKEYLPASLAGRRPDGHVVARSDESATAFRLGLKSFVNEARLLARFDHPSLVKVHRFWEDRGTAYMAMPYYEGATLRQVRKSIGGPPDEAWLQRLLDGLLGALEALHRADIVHRDVAPDNILVLPGGAPLLLDFGAARHVLAEQPQVLTAMLKPTYAPIEQYADSADLRQGPWTDVYATAATLHHCLTGEAPPAAAARTIDDRYRPLTQRAGLRQRNGQPYDVRWLAALDWALEVLPHRRPQSIAQWRAVLDGRQRLPRGARRTGHAAARAERSAAPDDFPATEVHARQWLPSDAPVTDAPVPWGAAPQAARATAIDVKEAVRPAVPDAPRPRSRRRPAAGVGSQRSWVAAGALALVAFFGLAAVLQSDAGPGRAPAAARDAPKLAQAPAAQVIGTLYTDGVSRANLPPAGVPKEFAAVSLHGPEEIHETAAEQGRPIRVPPRSFGTPDTPSRSASDRSGDDAKPAPRRRPLARAQAAAPLTPRQFCERDDRGWFSRMVCMHRSCDLPKWREHAQCENWRRPTAAQAPGLSIDPS